MHTSFWGPLVVWLLLNGALVPLTWRLVWPPYKRYGKVALSLGIAVALAAQFGWWSLFFVVLHPLAGFAGHVWWCRTHRLSVWRPDAEAYRRTQEEWARALAKRKQPEA